MLEYIQNERKIQYFTLEGFLPRFSCPPMFGVENNRRIRDNKHTMADAFEVPLEDRRYTYADYLSWEGPERYQLIYGEAFMMASPSVEHQAILVELSRQFSNWLRGKPCRVFVAPLDVRLFPEEDNSDKTVVQPDLLVVCGRDKLAKGSVNGPPDIAVEIISPSTSSKQHLLKFNAYLDAGIREYWVIDPEEKRAQVHVYENGHFISSAYKRDAVIQSTVLPDFSVGLKSLWAAAEDAVPPA
jgi:Uma2 family endonuclease